MKSEPKLGRTAIMQKRPWILCAGLLLLAAAPMGTSALAVPCRLTDGDMQSLAHPACGDCKPVTETGLDNLSLADQNELCKARRVLAMIQFKLGSGSDAQSIASTLSLKDIPLHVERFWTQQEYDQASDVIMGVIAASTSPQRP
jgi:hypothetical protein